jgi:hypothetical protein
MTMIKHNVIMKASLMLLAMVLASGIFVSQVGAQTPAPAAKPPVAAARSHFQPDRFAGRAGKYYALVWGIDSLDLKTVEAGEIIRFSYRVLDADKAKVLNDKKLNPVLNDPQAGVQLVVPSVANVGMLRQAPSTPVAGKSYWLAFSNKGRRVKRGDRVNVVIGSFHADGLVVD